MTDTDCDFECDGVPNSCKSRTNDGLQPFDIGQLVSFEAIALAEYVEQGKRIVRRQPIKEMLGYIVGKTTRYEGDWTPAAQGGWWNDGEWSEPTFSPSKAVTLWEVKIGWKNRVILLFDQDANPILGCHCLPHRAQTPAYVNAGPHKTAIVG